MNFLKNIDDDFTLILSLNDNAADGRDISWIWDVDFAGIFEKANVKEIYSNDFCALIICLDDIIIFFI